MNFTEFPSDIYRSIFLFLNPYDLSNLLCVNKKFYNCLLGPDEFWVVYWKKIYSKSITLINHIDKFIYKKYRNYVLNYIRKTYIFYNFFIYVDNMTKERRDKQYISLCFQNLHDNIGCKFLELHNDHEKTIINRTVNGPDDKLSIDYGEITVNYDCRYLFLEILLFDSIHLTDYTLFFNWSYLEVDTATYNKTFNHSVCQINIIKKDKGYKILTTEETCNPCASLFGLKGYRMTECDICDKVIYISNEKVTCSEFPKDGVKIHEYVDDMNFNSSSETSDNEDDMMEIPKEYLLTI